MAQYDSFKDLFGTNDPEEYRKKLALGLATEGISGAPIGHWTQGLNRVANAALAGYLMNKFTGDKKNDLYDEIDANRALTGQEPLARPNKNGLFDTFRKLGSSDQSPKPTSGYTTAGQPNGPTDDTKEGSGFITSVPPGGVPLPPNRPVYDRNKLNAEIQGNPGLATRALTMARGEVGSDPRAQQIELESWGNRGIARDTTGARELETYTGPGSRGYYPPQTFTNGKASPEALAAMLRGSDLGGQTLGFSPTGNASGGVAKNGIDIGRYGNAARLGGETFVTQEPPNQLRRLAESRVQAGVPDSRSPPTDATAGALPPGAQYASLQPQPNVPPGLLLPQQMTQSPSGFQQQPTQQEAPTQLAQARQGQGPQPRPGIGQFPPETLKQLEILDRQGMAGNKFAARQAQQIRQQLLAPDTYQMHTMGDSVVRFNPRDGSYNVIGSSSKPTYGVIGHDQFGNPQHGWIDPQAKTVTPGMPTQNFGGGTGAGTPSGAEFLKTLDPRYADQVKAITEGRMPPPGGMALKTPYWQQMLQLVGQYEPGFDLTAWSARKKTRDEFTAGGPNSPAGNITAGNTAIQHLGELSDAAGKLGNFQNLSVLTKPFNEARSTINTYSGNSEVSNFNNIRDKFAEEATKFYRGIGGSEADIKREIANINSAQSPKQLHDAIAAQTRLMQSKINALQDRWKYGMGPNATDFPIIQDKSQEAIDKIMKRAAGENTRNSMDVNSMTREELEAEARRRGMQ